MEPALASSPEPLPSDEGPPRRGGRPSSLTPAVEARLCEVIAGGVTLEVAAKYVGVSRRTLHRWLRLGRNKGPFRAFRRAVNRALAQAEMRSVLAVSKAGAKDWRAAAWMLEHRWPKRWGRTSRERAIESAEHRDPEKTAARIREFLKAARDLDSPPPPSETNP